MHPLFQVKNSPYSAALLGFLVFSASGAVIAQNQCNAEVSAKAFLDHAATQANSFSQRGAGSAGGSCLVHGVSAITNAGSEADKVCEFDALSIVMNEGWRLDSITFHQVQPNARLEANGGSRFKLGAAKGTTSQVTLVSFKICGPETDWHAAF
ncbi:MAG: hypothetical protein JKY34_15580 [Kordiimonadaceae bacterium]|nr:hypothetical protein [Kordiimonadaceae bacterium]